MGNREYGGIIWTNHALDRIGQRGLTQSLAWSCYRYPDEKVGGKEKNTTEFRKKVQNSLITLIATQNEKKQWVVISCWIDPPLPGSIDIKKKQEWQQYKKAGFFGKFFLVLKKQLGF